jgi:solute:Na+ symporter, SSS family
MIELLGFYDYLVMIGLLLFLIIASLYSSFKKKNSEDFFMAGRSLKWYSVAGSIFGTNIHAQQIIGMMGVGYSIGFAQSHYEVLAIPAILILCYVFIPIYRKNQVFTLSQFLENRYNATARLAYTILMIIFILVQLVAGFYIGSRTLGLLFAGSGMEVSYLNGIISIALITLLFSVFGGMESVVVADNILTIVMILAVVLIGILTYAQPEINGLTGLLKLDHAEANKMHLYLPSNHPKLPWAGIFTGLIIQHFFYWTTNQYQVQRVLAAATDRDAKLGTIAAGFLKLIIPFFSIAAGVAAFYIFKARFGADSIKPDDTFLTLLKTVVPSNYGFIGLILAGLICAIFSAIYSMMNSVSTMLSFDVYKKYINATASDKQTVRFGQFFIALMCLLASILAYTTYNPNSTDNFFLKLADQSSYLKPSLVVAFFWGVLWRKTNPRAAVIVLFSGPFIGLSFDYLYNDILVNIGWIKAFFGEKLNFLYRVFVIATIGSLLIYYLSKYFNKNEAVTKVHDLSVSFDSLRLPVLLFLLAQSIFLLLILLQISSPQITSYPAALVAFGFFVWQLAKSNADSAPFYQNDVFYAGLLTAITVWILYYFA